MYNANEGGKIVCRFFKYGNFSIALSLSLSLESYKSLVKLQSKCDEMHEQNFIA